MNDTKFMTRQLTFRTRSARDRSITCQFPGFCCACGKAAYPIFLSGYQFPQEVSAFLDNFFAFAVCPACGTGLIITYLIEDGEPALLTSYEPVKPKERAFDVSISNISDRFVKIYNQALAAETLNYDEIAGMGYRKALEILIKDFLISRNQDNKETIIKA